MKRRKFGLLAGSSVVAINTRSAGAQSAPASLLGPGITPLGGLQTGNSDGSIPPWTGGLTTLPVGVKPGDYVPELFPDEQPVVVVDASNMADHASMLSEGVMTMMTKYGFKIKVYPTHRTAAAPQWVYNNIAKNQKTAKFADQDPVGGRFGFENAYGGIPFPVPDIANPLTAGAQIVWNFNSKWLGHCIMGDYQSWSVNSGQMTLANIAKNYYRYEYYDPSGQPEDYDGVLFKLDSDFTGPNNLIGQTDIIWSFINPYKNAEAAWILLNGQGRVRRAPELSFDTPSSAADGIAGFDEYYGFNGSLERYDWKYLGKQETYIPYNNNGLYAADPRQAHLDHFLDPDLVRWEKHRCWVVEATLHPGERNVLSKRRLYIDEDAWSAGCVDAWDANGDLFKVNIAYNNCRPDLPGVVYGNNCVHNLQTDDYVSIAGLWNQGQSNIGYVYSENYPDSQFDPSIMAATSQY
jgi:hypothetical protein